jgi:hypothetical protein
MAVEWRRCREGFAVEYLVHGIPSSLAGAIRSGPAEASDLGLGLHHWNWPNTVYFHHME